MTASSIERCEACGKPTAICVCDRIERRPTRTRVIVLQHPQEPDKDLGTAPLLKAMLPACDVRVGLSWPSLPAALGADEPVANERWGVLYPLSLPAEIPPELAQEPVLAISRKGERLDLSRDPLDGIIALDGTWSQGKTLWWRNPWLLKLSRVLVQPHEPGIYGRVRKEPRKSFVSTLEAVADALVANGEDPETRAQLRKVMRTMVQRARDADARRPKRRD